MREHFYVTKSDEGWVGRREGKNHPMVKGSTKKEVVSEMVRVAKHHQPSSLKIQKMDGKFQEERTYPRTSDPSTSRG